MECYLNLDLNNRVVRSVFLNIFLTRCTLDKQYQYFAASLDAKRGFKVNKSDNWWHPWHYLTTLRLRTTELDLSWVQTPSKKFRLNFFYRIASWAKIFWTQFSWQIQVSRRTWFSTSFEVWIARHKFENESTLFTLLQANFKLRCDMHFQCAFTACGCVFKVITLVWANQSNYFENETACSKRTLKTCVSTQL